MPKRNNEPEEAFGPALDGFDDIEDLALLKEAAKLPALEQTSPEEALLPVACDEDLENVDNPVALICGVSQEAAEVISLAAECGFDVELAIKAGDEELPADFPPVDKTHIVPDYNDLVAICGIERNYFVCIFEADALECEVLLSQCLASDASYLGMAATLQKRDEVFAALRGDGAPDAELAAVCCPMGLNIRPETPRQAAVGIVAELLAAKGGTLKRLRHEPRENRFGA